jgi:excisionase family DNA binding protein
LILRYQTPIMSNPFETISQQLSNILERLNNISANPPPRAVEIITQDELCKRLMISKPTIIRWAKKKKIPLIRIGRSVRFNWQSVIDALESQKNKN